MSPPRVSDERITTILSDPPALYGQFYGIVHNLASNLRDARVEIVRLRGALKSAGVCMMCENGTKPPEPYGCTDCLNTGFDGGDPWLEIDRLRAELATARARALEEAAGIVEDGQETNSTQSGGATERFLTPRKNGNLAGLAYAAANGGEL